MALGVSVPVDAGVLLRVAVTVTVGVPVACAEALGVAPYFDAPFYVGFAVGGFELGLVPEGRQIFPTLTVFENMCIAAAIAHRKPGMFGNIMTPVRSAETTAAAEAAIELFQIGRYRDVTANALPQGVRKLLDIGMAVAGSPRLLLLDEPTSGISIEEKFDLMNVVMSALKTRKITVLFVEHDMEIVARFADRVLAFYDGTVIADGTAHETLDNPKVQELISGVRLKAGAHA